MSISHESFSTLWVVYVIVNGNLMSLLFFPQGTTWLWTVLWYTPCPFHRVSRDCERSYDIPRVPSTEYHVTIWCSTCSFHKVPRDCERWSDVPLIPSTEYHVIVNDDLILTIVPSTEYHVILNGDLMLPLFLPQSTTWLWTAIWCLPCSLPQSTTWLWTAIWYSPCSFHRVPRHCERWSDVFLVPSIEYHVILNGDLMFPFFLPQSTTWLWVVIWCSSCSFYRVPGDRERRSDTPLVPSTEYHVIVNGDLMHRTPCSFHRVLRDLKRRSDVPLVPSTKYHVIVTGDLMFALFLPQSTTWLWTAIWCSPCSFHRVPRYYERRSDVPLVPSTEYHVIMNDNLMVNLFLLQSFTWLWTIIWCSTCFFYRVPRDCERWSDVPLFPSTEFHVIVNDNLVFNLFLLQSITWLWTVIWCYACSFYRAQCSDRWSDIPLVPSTDQHVIVNGDLMCPLSFPFFLPQSTTWLWTAIWCSPCSFHRVPRDCER